MRISYGSSDFVSSDLPGVCVSRWLIVTGRPGARVIGLPSLAKPSSTCTSASAGSHFDAGLSRSSLPCSSSCNVATEVSALQLPEQRPEEHTSERLLLMRTLYARWCCDKQTSRERTDIMRHPKSVQHHYKLQTTIT